MPSPRSSARSIRTAGAALVLALGLAVSGCGLMPSPSLPPAPSATAPTEAPAPTASGEAPQPGSDAQAEQCAQLLSDVQRIALDVALLGERFGSGDLLGGAALLGSISSRVGELQGRVTDPALIERIEAIQAGWAALVADAEASLQAGDTSGIDRAITAMGALGEQVTALQQFCAGTA
ncbi:hypothetical protein AA0Z99_06125 [Agrococcus sp. 1P02AA]|uniref:hypothetical protein n=1 Tax=Agrococcus sp. 1P02AA TaxID=3132259 RepID=UPI0039A66AB9